MPNAKVLFLTCAMLAIVPAVASAQVPPGILPNPDLQNRIPAPLPPPPQAPVINGPLSQGQGGGQSSSQVYVPPRLNSQSDRTTTCVEQGATAGLSGADLDRYTRRCANAN